MPIYSYECAECEHTTTEERSIEDRREPVACPECGGASLLVISPVMGVVKNPAVPSGGKIRKK